MPDIIVIAHNIRSTHNVGAIFRTAEGFGVSKIILSGYSPYPSLPHDTRLPHIHEKLTRQIHKTALGAERLVPYEYQQAPDFALLKRQGYRLIGLEQSSRSVDISKYKSPDKIALLLGEEVDGITDTMLTMCEDVIEIPMHGQKESFNVSVATGIALFVLSNAAPTLQ